MLQKAEKFEKKIFFCQICFCNKKIFRKIGDFQEFICSKTFIESDKEFSNYEIQPAIVGFSQKSKIICADTCDII